MNRIYLTIKSKQQMKTPDIIFVAPYESKKFGDDYVGMAWDKPDDSCEHVAYIRRDLVDARILDMKNNLEEMKGRIEEEERRDKEFRKQYLEKYGEEL